MVAAIADCHVPDQFNAYRSPNAVAAQGFWLFQESLLEELPGIPALLPKVCGDREQSAAADGTADGLDSKTNFLR